ncbi:MAG: tRNA epoxyqueuosine(34) reductase QueG [Candidatus Hydrogenedentes bacterium]|nr:tRNA epoxyqueuosine(34) reductase QueG [Candidatus Hydrogenedentota bacterium]
MQSHSRAEITQIVKDAATDAGFDACGVALAGEIDPDNRLGEWLRLGYHADMKWIETSRELRQNAQLKLPGARSVVVVARNYYSPRPTRESQTGLVSRYAWGRDYHRVLLKPLRGLAKRVAAMAEGAQTYCCIDSGPVMEKAWAVRAGLGWMGKNSLVLRRDLGSWFFLGIILTTVELEPDSPAADQCGRCKLCIDACPTDAIVQPQVVDSRRCISYHTIENRGEIPNDIAANSAGWVFGCDICQEVCPWNKRVKLTTESEFHAREGHANPSLLHLENLTEDEFLDEFAGTPIMRAKLTGMRRNARMVREQISKKSRPVV